jgi:hypothetical protein
MAGLAILLTGVLAGVSFGRSSGIVDPVTIPVWATACGEADTHCKFFPIDTYGGKQGGDIETFNVPIADQDGTIVGRNKVACTHARAVAAICNGVEILHAGAHTEAGTVQFAGIWTGPSPDDPPAVFAITGGTGAYDNVRGHLTFGNDGTRFPIVMYLIP